MEFKINGQFYQYKITKLLVILSHLYPKKSKLNQNYTL